MVQQVKDLALSLLWLRFDPWELLCATGTAKKMIKEKKKSVSCRNTHKNAVEVTNFIKSQPLGFFFLFRAAPKAYGGSQVRGPIRATAAGLCHSHSNTRSSCSSAAYTTAMPDP